MLSRAQYPAQECLGGALLLLLLLLLLFVVVVVVVVVVGHLEEKPHK